MLRCVERNPLRANLVADAADWRWSSLWHRLQGNPGGLLDDGPVALPRRWWQYVETPQTEAELAAHQAFVVPAPRWRIVVVGADGDAIEPSIRVACARSAKQNASRHLEKDSRPFFVSRSVAVSSIAAGLLGRSHAGRENQNRRVGQANQDAGETSTAEIGTPRPLTVFGRRRFAVTHQLPCDSSRSCREKCGLGRLQDPSNNLSAINWHVLKNKKTPDPFLLTTPFFSCSGKGTISETCGTRVLPPIRTLSLAMRPPRGYTESTAFSSDTLHIPPQFHSAISGQMRRP